MTRVRCAVHCSHSLPYPTLPLPITKSCALKAGRCIGGHAARRGERQIQPRPGAQRRLHVRELTRLSVFRAGVPPDSTRGQTQLLLDDLPKFVHPTGHPRSRAQTLVGDQPRKHCLQTHGLDAFLTGPIASAQQMSTGLRTSHGINLCWMRYTSTQGAASMTEEGEVWTSKQAQGTTAITAVPCG